MAEPGSADRGAKARAAQRAAVAAVALLAAALAFLQPVTALDHALLDGQFRALRALGRTPPMPDVVVVGIDRRSTEGIPVPMGLWHRQIAELLLAMREARPKSVALDVVLPDRSYEDLAPGLDVELLRALLVTRSAFPTILPVTVGEDRQTRRVHPPFLAAAGTKPGYALWPIEGDGVIRRFDEHLGARGERIDTLAGEIARQAGVEPREGYIDYALGELFGYIAFIDVLEAARRGDAAQLERWFRGKVVVVGVTLQFADVARTPVQLAAWGPKADETPGALVQAQAARALLAGRILPPVAPWIPAGLAAGAACLALLASRARSGAWLAAGVAALLLVLSHAALRAGHVLPVAWALKATLVAFAAFHGLDVLRNLAERRRLRQSFGGYVSPGVMDEILAGRIRPEIDGAEAEVCVLFSDIRGYTTRSEGMKPSETLAFLNRYFEGVVGIIHEHGGTVISFMGDGIMAVFGAPKPLAKPGQAGFDAALAMLANVEALNPSLRSEGVDPIAIGIGLHSGTAIMGHVGSRARHEYTAIGDVTNVASRLESATKEVGYRIVCSREVAEQLARGEELVALGPISIKGHAPVEAFGHTLVG